MEEEEKTRRKKRRGRIKEVISFQKPGIRCTLPPTEISSSGVFSGVQITFQAEEAH